MVLPKTFKLVSLQSSEMAQESQFTKITFKGTLEATLSHFGYDVENLPHNSLRRSCY